ncbi:hypothetical protein [Streptomyces sp. NPDC059881]|uniref:hypothetical protein n=1 Tax=Streptomyces sp. NPDC059881 TaxID=3346986 RepID=UPI00365BEB55
MPDPRPNERSATVNNGYQDGPSAASWHPFLADRAAVETQEFGEPQPSTIAEGIGMANSPELPKPRPLHELEDVHDYLDDVRLRPSMYVRGRSILHLQSILYGYSLACEIHGVPAVKDFDQCGPFSEWLWPRLGMRQSSLGWEVEIERAAEAAGIQPLDMFFDLLDEFRARRDDEAQEAPR